MADELSPIPWDKLKEVNKADRRRYYLDLFPDSLGLGRTIPWGFILDRYLPDLLRRHPEDLKSQISDLVLNEDELKLESIRFKELFEQYVDKISSIDPHFAAIANTTKGIHFVNTLAVLGHSPIETLPGIPEDHHLDRDFWENLQKIIEAAELE